MNGTLGEKLLTDIIRELGQTKASGLLRLTQGKTIKALFFESGAPIFAISNQAKEQIDYHLVREGCATREQIDEALKKAQKMHLLGQTLVETGVIDDQRMAQATRQLAREIILSVFGWTHGEFVFDERMKADHRVKLEWTALDCILEGARAASSVDQFAQTVAPDNRLICRSNSKGSSAFSASLNSAESYLLARLDSPTLAADLASLCGLGQEETRKALCALVSVGLLRVLGGNKTSQDDGDPAQVSADLPIVDEIHRKLEFFASADCYEILGVTRRSTTGDVKAAYYKLAKRFHPDMYRQPEHKDIHSKVERLFAKISEAYETLIDPSSRSSYDEQTRKATKVEVPPEPPMTVEPPRERKLTSEETDSGPLAQSVTPPTVADNSTARQKVVSNPAQAAEYYYQQGRSRNDQKDHYGAVTLLREAVKLDSSKPHYHYHLGTALLKNPRTRREGELHLIKAAELDPFNSEMRVRLGLLYKQAGLPKKAEHYFREALAMEPDNRIALRELSKKQRSGGKDDVPLWKADIGTIAKKIFKK